LGWWLGRVGCFNWICLNYFVFILFYQQNERIIETGSSGLQLQKAGNRRNGKGDPGKDHGHLPSRKSCLMQNDVKEFGTVISIGDGIARVVGLNKVQAGEMV